MKFRMITSEMFAAKEIFEHIYLLNHDIISNIFP